MNKTLYTLLIPRTIFLLITSCVLNACQNYSISLNQNEIYSPPTLFSDYIVHDTGLRQCLKQNIEEQLIRSAENLYSLICGNLNITSLEGINQFPKIKNLGLANNKIKDLIQLTYFKELEHVDLSHNQLISINTLKQIESLKTVNLRGNPKLECIRLASNVSTLMPKHCL